jgi:hypothetical protein
MLCALMWSRQVPGAASSHAYHLVTLVHLAHKYYALVEPLSGCALSEQTVQVIGAALHRGLTLSCFVLPCTACGLLLSSVLQGCPCAPGGRVDVAPARWDHTLGHREEA